MFRLMFMDAQPVTFRYGTLISAYTIVDGRGRAVSYANTEKHAHEIRERFSAKFQQTTFHVKNG